MRAKEIIKEWGRIVQGVNTTVDVGKDEIQKQAEKFGNKVSPDGEPEFYVWQTKDLLGNLDSNQD